MSRVNELANMTRPSRSGLALAIERERKHGFSTCTIFVEEIRWQRNRIEELIKALRSQTVSCRPSMFDYQCDICCKSAVERDAIKHSPNCILAKEPTDEQGE